MIVPRDDHNTVFTAAHGTRRSAGCVYGNPPGSPNEPREKLTADFFKRYDARTRRLID